MERQSGELILRVGSVVINLSKEGKNAMPWTLLSCLCFIPNRVRISLYILAYSLGDFLRRIAPPKEVSSWSLSGIQLKLVKTGAKVIFHARRTIFQLAEVALSEALLSKILARIHGLRYSPT